MPSAEFAAAVKQYEVIQQRHKARHGPVKTEEQLSAEFTEFVDFCENNSDISVETLVGEEAAPAFRDSLKERLRVQPA